MKLRVVVLGAGFGGLELTSILSEMIGDRIELTLIDKNDSFYFGFSKFDVMFGHKSSEAVKILLPQYCKTRRTISPGNHYRYRSGCKAGNYKQWQLTKPMF